MSIHDAFLELAAAAIDFDLDDEELAELDRHLAACDACRGTAEAFRDDAAAITQATGPLLSPARSVAILAAALHRPKTRSQFRPLAIAGLVAILGVGLVAAGIAYIRRPQDPLVAVQPSPGISQSPGSSTDSSLGPTASPAGTPRPPASPAVGALPVRANGQEIGTMIRLAPGADDDLYVSVPAPDGTVVTRLDERGLARPGWPMMLPGARPCGLLLPVEDGSVRVVCATADLPNDPGADPAVRAFAFDSGGNLLPGWPVDLPCCFTGRVIRDTLAVYGRQTIGDVFEEGKPAGNAWMVTVGADGTVRNGTPVPLLGDCCLDTWAVGPDGVAYGTTHRFSSGSGPPTSELTAVSLAGVPGGFPVTIDGIASGPAFDAAGRIHVIVGSPSERPARTLVYDSDGRAVAAGSGDLDVAATSDWNGAGGELPAAPLVSGDGTTFVIDTNDGTTVAGLEPSGRLLAGWPYRSAVGLEDSGFCPPGDTGCGGFRAAPAVDPDNVLYLLHAAGKPSSGGSVVAVGEDGRIRAGWPVGLTRPGSEFWSVVVAQNGTAYVVAIEPEPNGSHSATILALAPDSTVVSRTTIVEP